jgi:hypothetical protein
VVAGHPFAGTNYGVRSWDGDHSALGLLGNDVLKRFDLVLDNREGAVYLRPNQHAEEPYRSPERLVNRIALGLIVGTAVAVGVRRALRAER